MKILVVLISSLAIALTSCKENKTIFALKKDIYYTTPDSTNFQNSAKLKGFSEFAINETTVGDIFKIYNRAQENIAYYSRSPLERDFTDGYLKIDNDNYDLIAALEKQKSIAQFYISDYKIGELNISQLYLLCLNDTLVGIYLPICDNIIFETFLNKYGKGTGYEIDHSEFKADPVTKKDLIIFDIAEKRVWENKLVKAEYCETISTRYDIIENYLMISDKTGKFTRLNNLFALIKQRLINQKNISLKNSLEKI